MALGEVSLTISILLFMMALAVQPLVTETACPRYFSSCGPYSSYYNTYDSQVNQDYKTLDGIQAQISYINLADHEQVCDNIV